MLSKFPNSTLKIGAPVSLSPNHSWQRGEFNPVGIYGRVYRMSSSRVAVEWSNGNENTYLTEAFDLIAEGEPGFMEVE